MRRYQPGTIEATQTRVATQYVRERKDGKSRPEKNPHADLFRVATFVYSHIGVMLGAPSGALQA